MEERRTYYAFVSYSHKDQKWAKWIQESLEKYRLPNIVRKEIRRPLPKTLAPVFRDATDLAVGKLIDNLNKELEESQYLIVVCSPNSAASNAEGKNYVDAEIRHFRVLGREDRIIPVIVSGTSVEAFSPGLKEFGVIAIDATKMSKARVLNDIVAKMLGLRPDELWRRERRRRLFRRYELFVAVGLLFVVAALGGLSLFKSQKMLRQQTERAEFEKRILPYSINFSYMTAYAKPLVRSCSNETCIVIAAMPANYKELANDPKMRELSILADVSSLGWTNCTKRISVPEKKRGIGVIELHRASFPIRGARVYLDTISMMSSLRPIVNYITDHSPYYSKEDRDALTIEYIAEFRKGLEMFLSEDEELKGRTWKLYFVECRDSLEKALGEIERSFGRK